MALSELEHHSSRGQRKDRARGEVRVEPHGGVPEAPLPREVPGHKWGWSGTSWSTWRTSAHSCRFSMLLWPQPVENVTDTLRILDLSMAEQVIEVPKISCSPCPSRSLFPEPQSAEQLVEVPTVLSPLRIAEQIVGIRVPRGRGNWRVQGFSQNRVQQRRILLANAFLSGLWSRSLISQRRLSSRSLTFLLVVPLGRVRPHLLVLQMRILVFFFRTFPHGKMSAHQPIICTVFSTRIFP